MIGDRLRCVQHNHLQVLSLSLSRLGTASCQQLVLQDCRFCLAWPCLAQLPIAFAPTLPVLFDSNSLRFITSCFSKDDPATFRGFDKAAFRHVNKGLWSHFQDFLQTWPNNISPISKTISYYAFRKHVSATPPRQHVPTTFTKANISKNLIVFLIICSPQSDFYSQHNFNKPFFCK